jgi:hypothetical protein
MISFKQYVTEASYGTPTPQRQVSMQELQTLLNKRQFNSMTKHKWFDIIRGMDQAYKYSVNNAGFVEVEVYAYYRDQQTTPDGKIRPEQMYRFVFNPTKVVQAHMYYRSRVPDEQELRHGPSAGWKHLKDWK